ncbi:MAG: GNAT family N-acetyltransferase [Defluviitaleaceae bacterium]|nr:GNAT family N-acetyltransferase [Defluviitaleaceae bacterium]
MTLQLYSDELFSIQIETYVLGKTPYTGTPQNIVKHAMFDSDRFAVAISDEDGKLIGFFGLHLGAGPQTYGYIGEEYALVRGMSIDERHRGNGYGVKCFEHVFEFIHEEISDTITSLILGVNEQNISAQKAYEKAGFKKKPGFVQGKLGKLIIMEKQKSAS